MLSNIHLPIVFIGVAILSWLLGKALDLIAKQPKNPTHLEKYFIIQPNWANILCVRPFGKAIDKYAAQFQIGGITLLIIGCVLSANVWKISAGGAFWLGIIAFYGIPAWLLRSWQRNKLVKD